MKVDNTKEVFIDGCGPVLVNDRISILKFDPLSNGSKIVSEMKATGRLNTAENSARPYFWFFWNSHCLRRFNCGTKGKGLDKASACEGASNKGSRKG